MQRTLLDFFRCFADSPAEFVVYDDGYRRWKYSYRQIAAAAQAFSARLHNESIAEGEKVLLWSENRPEWLAAFWGCLWTHQNPASLTDFDRFSEKDKN